MGYNKKKRKVKITFNINFLLFFEKFGIGNQMKKLLYLFTQLSQSEIGK